MCAISILANHNSDLRSLCRRFLAFFRLYFLRIRAMYLPVVTISNIEGVVILVVGINDNLARCKLQCTNPFAHHIRLHNWGWSVSFKRGQTANSGCAVSWTGAFWRANSFLTIFQVSQCNCWYGAKQKRVSSLPPLTMEQADVCLGHHGWLQQWYQCH